MVDMGRLQDLSDREFAGVIVGFLREADRHFEKTGEDLTLSLRDAVTMWLGKRGPSGG